MGLVLKNGVAYDDSNGRMLFNDEFHHNHCKNWTISELAYMCGMWGVARVRDISLALGRTESACLQQKFLLVRSNQFDYYRELHNKDL